jgi:hypothetical protein
MQAEKIPSSNEILERVRHLAAKARRATAQQRTSVVPQLNETMLQVQSSVGEAESNWDTGQRTPTIEQLPFVVRTVALPMARLVLRAKRILTWDQRAFNRAALDGLKGLLSTLDVTLANSSRIAELSDAHEALKEELTNLREELTNLRTQVENLTGRR